MKTLVVGDIHGCLDEFKQMIEEVQPDEIYTVGDLIDRGPKSKEVVQFCIDNNVKVCLGNHEYMAIEAIDEYDTTKPFHRMWLQGTDWFLNGGDIVYEQYKSLEELREHIEYFKSLPIYYKLDYTYLDKPIVISHTLITNYLDDLDGIGPTGKEAGKYTIPLLWNRDKIVNVSSKYFNIHGHSPTDWYKGLDKQPYLNQYQLNLDTGCAYKSIPTRGVLTGVVLPEMYIVQVGLQ